jgi:hypothetical protein
LLDFSRSSDVRIKPLSNEWVKARERHGA